MRKLLHPRRQYYLGKCIDSPVGQLELVASDRGLAAILWENDNPGRVPLGEVIEHPDDPVLMATERQLQEYFAGARRQFDVPLNFQGTEFQKRVWCALLTIPFGETRSYVQLATQIGCPAAVRAVGAANGRNPLSIIAPCHRVVGSNGQLTGFAGGLEVKAKLLSMERRVATASDSLRHLRTSCAPALG
ncbi:MAG TPA: methylated-DNA--[protein]-cysteine S-methyltransferase [Steroidobacter sp.]|uniref:methylated-DNA--[protein]-cysteine S-methyltransferase n=1 Tax=Steroidobacter sp. TaxID=1978227 RepID=UPI002ED7AB69